MIEKNCKICNKIFLGYKNRLFCSNECRRFYKNSKLKIKTIRYCNICNKEYISNIGTKKTCSKECSILYDKKCKHERYLKNIEKHKIDNKIRQQKRTQIKQQNKVPKECLICNNLFFQRTSQHKICSKECRKIERSKSNKVAGIKYRQIHKKPKLKIKCSICEKDFYHENKNVKYCTRECKKTILWIISLMRSRINDSLNSRKKEKHTLEYMNCTVKQFKEHLEKQFDKNMNWSNYGKYWHVDHIIPVSAFNLTIEENIYKCWSLKNLQPLESKENIKKSAKILPQHEQLAKELNIYINTQTV